MKILYIHQYFKTPLEPGGNRSYWIAKKLIGSGHEVTMITTKNNLQNKRIVKNIDGINTIYLNVNYSQNMSLFSRATSFASFSLRAFRECLKHRKKIDIIYATSTPLTVGIPALLLNILFRKPYVFEVRDLWPEAPIQMGVIKNKFLIRILYFLERTLYKRAKSVVTLSPGMQDGVLSKGIEKNKVYMVPNMSKLDHFYPRPKNNSVIKRFRISAQSLNIIYFGSLGKSNGLTKVIEFFGKTKHKVRLLIAGGGSELIKIKNQILSNNIKNVETIGQHDMLKVSEIVNCCDISLISFLNLPILDTNSPNKLFDSLSAGKPILLNSKGWTKKLVKTHKCGYYYDYDSFSSFEKTLGEIINNKDKLKAYGKNSRKLAVSKFDKAILTKKISLILE